MKWLKIAVSFFLVLAVIAALAVLAIINPWGPSPLNRYQTNGQIHLKGLTQPVRVQRDEKGMAYIHAQNRDDLFMAQGFVTATDRLFQMQLTRLYAAGRIGELAGPVARPIDVGMRTLGFLRRAEIHFKQLDAATQNCLQKYVDGVNAFIRQRKEEIHLEFKLAGIAPEPWRPQDALSLLYFMGWNSSANVHHEITIQMLVEKLGLEEASKIFPLNVNPAEPEAQTARTPIDDRHHPRLGLQVMRDTLDSLKSNQLRMGSNNWVVGPERTKHQKAILANDPHLEANMLPGPWYPCGLILPDRRAVGVNVPGIPGIVVGRTDHIAFGVTNAYADTQDLYIETVDPQNPDHYLEGKRSIPFEILKETLKFKDKSAPGGYTSEILQIRKTRRGPVISKALPRLNTDKVMTVRWSAFEDAGSSLGLEEFLTADSAAEFRDALKHFRQISLNFVFADTDGNIGWQVTGRVPIRSRGDGVLPYTVSNGRDNWQGWIPFGEMPHNSNPEEGWLGTANHKTVSKSFPYYYSNYFSSSFRQKRLMEIMEQRAPTGAEDHWEYQRDIVNLKAQRIVPIMAQALIKNEQTRTMGVILADWDAEDRPDQPAPTLFHCIWNEFARRVYTDELGPELTHAMLSNTYFWEERLVTMTEADDSPWFDDVNTPDIKETRNELLQIAAETVKANFEKEVDLDPHNWIWGRYHQYEFFSPLARTGPLKAMIGAGRHAAAGSGDTLNRSKSAYDHISDVSLMASLRMVVDLGDPDKVLAVLPGGVAGRQFHPHYKDQIASFLKGDQIYWYFSDTAIQAHVKHTLTLAP